MPAKIRLQRQGRKFQAIYSIVVADSRAPRDGKFIESLGQYNPNTNPATIVLDFNKALEWLQNGAQPTDTCRAILSYKGVLYKKHLLEGVKKGAFDEAEAERRFQAWMTEKEQKIQANKDKIKTDKDSEVKSRLDAEAKIKEARALEIAKKRSELVEAEQAAAADEEAAPAEESATADEEPAAAEEKSAPADEKAPVEEKPAAEEKKEEKSATADEEPAAAEEKSAEEKKEEKKSAAADEEKAESATADEKAPVEEKPAAEEKKEEKSAAADEEKAESAPADKKKPEEEEKKDK